MTVIPVGAVSKSVESAREDPVSKSIRGQNVKSRSLPADGVSTRYHKTSPSNPGRVSTMVSLVPWDVRNDRNVLVSEHPGVTWPASAVAVEGVKIGSVALH